MSLAVLITLLHSGSALLAVISVPADEASIVGTVFITGGAGTNQEID